MRRSPTQKLRQTSTVGSAPQETIRDVKQRLEKVPVVATCGTPVKKSRESSEERRTATPSSNPQIDDALELVEELKEGSALSSSLPVLRLSVGKPTGENAKVNETVDLIEVCAFIKCGRGEAYFIVKSVTIYALCYIQFA